MIATYTLPRPISLNNCFQNVRGKGRVKTERYRKWIDAAGKEIMAQGPIRKVPGEVTLVFGINRPRKNMDLDNCFKPYIDLLVSLGAIDDDRSVVGIDGAWTLDGSCFVHINQTTAQVFTE